MMTPQFNISSVAVNEYEVSTSCKSTLVVPLEWIDSFDYDWISRKRESSFFMAALGALL